MKKRTKIFTLFCLSAVTFLTGCGFGNAIFPQHRPPVDVGELDDPELQNKYLNRPEGKAPKDIENINDILFITAGVLKDTNYWTSIATGKVKAKVGFIPYDQQVVSNRIVNNEEGLHECFFQTNTISAFVKKSEQRFTNDNSWLTRTGSSPTINGAKYTKDNIKALSEKAYLERYGNLSSGLSNYVLNDYTVESGTYVGEENGLFVYDYVLNAKKSTARYVREVKFMSDSSDYPIFSKASITIKIDNDFKIHEAVNTDSYNVAIMGGLNCDSVLVDKFDFKDSYITIPEKEDFKDKMGTVDDDLGGDKEKSAMDYLTEAAQPLLTSNKPMNLKLALNVNGNTLPIYASLNLLGMNIKASIADKMYLYYKNNKVYVWCGDKLNFLVDKDELLNTISHFVPGFSINNISIESLLSSDLLSGAMDNMVLEKNKDSVKMTMEMKDISVIMNLALDSNGKASFSTINLEGKLDNLPLTGSVEFVDESHEYMEIPSSINQITNLSGLTESIDRYLEKKNIAGTIDLNLSKDIKLSGNYGLSYSKALEGYLDLILDVKGEQIPLNLSIQNNYVYVELADKLVKLTFEECAKLFNVIVERFNLTNVSLNGDLLSKLDISHFDEVLTKINNSIDSLAFDDNGIDLSINLKEFKLGNTVSLNYDYNTSNFSMDITDLGKVTLNVGSDFTLNIPSRDAIGYVELENMINSIADIYDLKSFVISGEYNLSSDTNIKFNATIDLNQKRAEGELSFNLLSMQGKVRFALKNNEILFMISDDIKVLLTPEEVIQLYDKLKEILAKRGINASFKPKFDFSNISITEIINSISISESSLDFIYDLAKLNISLLKDESVNLKYDFANNNVNIALKNGNISLKAEENLTFTELDSTGALKYNDFVEIIDDVDLLVDDLSSFEITLNSGKNSYKVYVSSANDINKIYVQIDETNGIYIYREGNEAYIDALGLKIKGDLNTVLKVLENVLNANGINDPKLSSVIEKLIAGTKIGIEDILGLATIEINTSSKTDINTLIKSLTYSNHTLTIDTSSAKVTATLDKEEFLNVTAKNFGIVFNRTSNFVFTDIDKATYIDISSIKNVSVNTYISLFNFINAKQYSGQIKGIQLSFNGKTYTISGNVSVDLINNAYEIDASVTDGTYTALVNVKLINNETLYITYDNLVVKTTINEVKDLLTSMKVNMPTIDVMSLVKKALTSITSIDGEENSLGLSFNNTEYNINGSIKYHKDNGVLINTNLAEINLVPSEVKVVIDETTKTVDLSYLVSYVEGVTNAKGVEGSFAFNIYNTPLGTLELSGDISLDINKKFDISSKFVVSNKDFHVEIDLVKVNMDYYIDLGNVKIKLTNDELFNLVIKLNQEYKLGLLEDDIVMVKDLIVKASSGDIQALLDYLNSGNNSKIDLNSILSKIDILQIVSSISASSESISGILYLDNLSTLLGNINFKMGINSAFNIELNGSSSIRHLYLTVKDTVTITAPVFSNALGNEELADLMTKAEDVMNTFTKKQFSLSLKGNAKHDGQVTYSYDGTMQLDITDSKNIKMSFNATITGPKNGTPQTHVITGKMCDGNIYIVYNKKLKVHMSVKQLLQLVRYLTELMNINSDILNSLLDGVTEGLGSGVFDPVIPEMKPLDIDVNKFIYSLAVNKDEKTGTLQDLHLKADCEQIYENLSGFNPNKDSTGNVISTENSIIDASIATKNGVVSTISVTNIYAFAGETFDLNLTLDDSIYSQASVDFGIAAPTAEELASYYDFDSFTALLKMFVNTANIASYRLEGSLFFQLQINVFGKNIAEMLGKPELPIIVNIELDENSVPNVHLHTQNSEAKSFKIKIPLLGTKEIIVFDKGTLDLYYVGKTQTIYIRRDNEYRTYTTADLSDPGKMSEMIIFIMNPDSTVSSAIKNQINKGFKLNSPIKFEDVLTKYESTYENSMYKYNLIISGSALIQENLLGDVRLDISTLHSTHPDGEKTVEQDYLHSLDVETLLMNIFNVQVVGNLTNVFTDKAPEKVSVPLPAGIENGTGW